MIALCCLIALVLLEVGDAHSLRKKYEKKFRHEDDDDENPRDDCDKDKKPSKPCFEKKTLVYDYGIVGQGAGGVDLAYKLAKSLKRAGEHVKGKVSIVAFEADSQIGGNVRYAKLKKPPGYETLVTAGDAYGKELFGDEGPQRIIPATLGIERREAFRLGLDVAYTTWRNQNHLNGKIVRCGEPTAAANENSTASNPFLADDFYAFGASCEEDAGSGFIGSCGAENSALFRNLFGPDCENCAGDADRQFAVYAWLLKGMNFRAAELFPDLKNGENYGADDAVGEDGLHPTTCANCTVGLNCPYDLAKTTNDDWFTHIARQTSANELDSNLPLLNYAYALYMKATNVGFNGDFEIEAGARSLSDYNVREYQTNSITGYIPGGMRRLVGRMWQNATSNGMTTFLNEPVRKIDFLKKSPYKYRIETDKKIVLIKKHLFLNLPPFFLRKEEPASETPWVGRFISGSVIDALRAVGEVQAPVPQTVVRILAQWEPGVRAWFWDLFDDVNGAWSFRTVGNTGCFSRAEFLDTPYHRCTNHIVPVYTDALCQRLWLDHYEEFLRTNDSMKLKQRVADEFKASFPELADKITLPELVDFEYFPSGWHYVQRSFDNIYENVDITRKAARPLGMSEPISLIGEAYASSYSGWMEGAFRTVELALRNISGSPALKNAIAAEYVDLYNVRKEMDGSVSDGSYNSIFAYTPPLYPVPDTNFMFPNENWWPRPQNIFVTALDYCNATKAGLRPFNDI